MITKFLASARDRELLASLKMAGERIGSDLSDYTKVVVKKPWGYEYLIFGSEAIAVWILCVKPGAQTSMHCHPNKKTSLVVLEGEVVCSTVSERRRCTAGQGLLLEKGVFHQTTAVSESGAFVMEIETPVDKRDLVRLKDKYGREQLGYETPDHYSGNIQNYNYISLDEGAAIAYNRKKRFGECSLTFQRVATDRDVQELLHLNREEVVCVLQGRLLDGTQHVTYEVGDTVTIHDLQSVPGLCVRQAVELLVIKRMDTMLKVSDYVSNFLRTQQVGGIFLVPGEATVHLLDSIGRTEGLSFICCQSERSASLAAEGYAKVNAEVGVLVISSGGSTLSALPGVGNAWVDSVPLLVLSGQTRTDHYAQGPLRQLDNKSLNIIDLVKPITKYAVRIDDPATIQYHLEQAVSCATEGRPGPVWLDIPIDVQGMTIDASDLKPFVPSDPTPQLNGASSHVPNILAMLQEATRPVLLAGSGIRIAHAQQELLALIDHLRIPVLTSRRGADLVPDDHPLCFGRPGIYGQRRSNFMIQNADLLLSVGCRLSIPLIGRNTKAFARGAKKIVVDIDQEELRKSTVTADLAVKQDAKVFLTEMLRQMKTYRADHAVWVEQCRTWSRRFPPMGWEAGASPPRLLPYLVVATLSDLLQEDDVLVVDGGSPVHKVMQAFHVKRGQRLISSTGLELPGFALAGAIGASVKRGRKSVACVSEDRGFHIGVPELQTIVDYRLPIKMFVFNSRGNTNLRKIQRDYFAQRYIGTDQEMVFGAPDLIAIARAYGIATVALNRPEDMRSTIRGVLEVDGPVMCAIEAEDDQDVLPRIGFTVKEDGKWIAKPLEDMHPYLDRQTLKDNMLVPLLEED